MNLPVVCPRSRITAPSISAQVDLVSESTPVSDGCILDAVALRALEFFAGSGLVRLGLEPEFRTLWANDISAKKRDVYVANHGGERFLLKSIEEVRGEDLPAADLAWASFPCQDLSLAGSMKGIQEGTRSGLFWNWMRVIDELGGAKKRPPVLVAENVVGFLTSNSGLDFKKAYRAFRDRGYRAGALVLDAKLFVPQSRPRAFVVAVDEGVDVSSFSAPASSLPFHPTQVLRAANAVDDSAWIWWNLPVPDSAPRRLTSLIERRAKCDGSARTRDLIELLSAASKSKLRAAVQIQKFLVGTGYRRTRPDENGRKRQRLELRFDGVAGCLRTPEGGSSRQVLVIVDRGRVKTRLLTVRECARLMGAPDTFEVPGSYNDGYRAMGDGVAVPVTRWLTQKLLAPLSKRARSRRGAAESAA